ncbi:MAG TPA: cytochrome c biogenesis protein CcsA [Spirochaetales bacterium]|nr:cytochrome c biogenesis protein CcsA [Spirochaetales bacterium]
MNLSQVLASISFVACIVSALVMALYLFRKDAAFDRVSPWSLGLSSLCAFASLALRSMQIGFVALTSTYESLLFYASVITALVLLARIQKRIPFVRGAAFGSVFVAIVIMAVASSPLLPKEALSPIPALRSGWLLLHVSFSFIGEAFFVSGFVASIMFLVIKSRDKRDSLDRITYTMIAIGYAFFTSGALVFGSIWAQKAWGRWWSWDPKETWALVSWLVYTLYLHIRLNKKRKDSLPSVVSVIGFLCTVFTFFGVNYLLPGLHSYG